MSRNSGRILWVFIFLSLIGTAWFALLKPRPWSSLGSEALEEAALAQQKRIESLERKPHDQKEKWDYVTNRRLNDLEADSPPPLDTEEIALEKRDARLRLLALRSEQINRRMIRLFVVLTAILSLGAMALRFYRPKESIMGDIFPGGAAPSVESILEELERKKLLPESSTKPPPSSSKADGN